MDICVSHKFVGFNMSSFGVFSFTESLKEALTVCIALLGTVIIADPSQAAIRYEAKIDATAKQLWSDTDSKIRCELIYDVPEFGSVIFTTRSGHNSKTSLEVHPKRGINEDSKMRFIAARPEWQSGGQEKLLGEIKLYAGFDPFAGETVAWKVLNALTQGKQIFMPYTSSTQASGQNIIPTISPLGFKSPYQRFLSCQQRLLKVSFNDIQMLPVVFRFQSEELTGRSRDRLNEQLEYLKEDKAISKITIRAFAYDKTSKDENIVLAKNRADALAKFYRDLGFKDDELDIKPFNALTLPVFVEGQDADESPTARNGLVEIERDSSKIDRMAEDVDMPDVGAESGE